MKSLVRQQREKRDVGLAVADAIDELGQNTLIFRTSIAKEN